MKGLSMILSLTLLLSVLSGCKSAGGNASSDAGSNASAVTEVNFADRAAEMFTDRDYEVGYDESSSVLIQLNGDSAVSSSNAVKISGSTITITEEGCYLISGTLSNGMIVIDADKTDKLRLVLNGVAIQCAASAPLYIKKADKVFITLAPDSVNTLANGGTFTAIDENNIDAAIFSKQDLTLNGSGSLTVTSPAGHGIAAKDDLAITSGTYTVASASHGIDANDSVRIASAAITIDAGKDGIHAENTDDSALGFVYIASGSLNINAQGDGVSAGAYMQIEGGSFDIVSGGGSANAAKHTSDSWGGFMGGRRPDQPAASSSADDSGTSIKGLKAAGPLLLSDGSFIIDAADDAIHSNTSITVNGGTFEIASGDDAFHADENLTVSGGTINITESYEGLEALHVAISGGEIKLVAADDGLNAAGGNDMSGFGGDRGDDQFGGGPGGTMPDGGRGNGRFGGPGGNMPGSSSSNGTITISGGSLSIKASGDGIDANGSLTISGGHIVVCGPIQGDTSTLDFDTTGVITGGTFIGTGASGMAQTFTGSDQGVISAKTGSQSAGTTVTLKDKSGSTILSHTPELPFDIVILSSPDLVSGESYTLIIGSASGEFTAS